METVEFLPPYIKLEQFLKLCNAADTGGMAKQVIIEGKVKVNDEVCTMRGKKLKGGEKVSFMGKDYYCKIIEN